MGEEGDRKRFGITAPGSGGALEKILGEGEVAWDQLAREAPCRQCEGCITVAGGRSLFQEENRTAYVAVLGQELSLLGC